MNIRKFTLIRGLTYKKRLAIFPVIFHDVFDLNGGVRFHIMERGIQRHDESIQACKLFHNHRHIWYSYPGLNCLQPGKYTHVDYDQQVDTQDADDTDKREFLHCTECHYAITRKSDRIQINEQHQHVFANPHGYIFHIGCFAQAPGCVIASEETSYFSWFPGYAWQIALCGQCLTLLGWAFHSSESQFFGLILDKLK